MLPPQSQKKVYRILVCREETKLSRDGKAAASSYLLWDIIKYMSDVVTPINVSVLPTTALIAFMFMFNIATFMDNKITLNTKSIDEWRPSQFVLVPQIMINTLRSNCCKALNN